LLHDGADPLCRPVKCRATRQNTTPLPSTVLQHREMPQLIWTFHGYTSPPVPLPPPSYAFIVQPQVKLRLACLVEPQYEGCPRLCMPGNSRSNWTNESVEMRQTVAQFGPLEALCQASPAMVGRPPSALLQLSLLACTPSRGHAVLGWS
jgi:hypothetical protein